jgi:hypothetical protein
MKAWLNRSGCRATSIRVALQGNIVGRHVKPCISNASAAMALRIFFDSTTRCQHAELVWEDPNFPVPTNVHSASLPLRTWDNPDSPPLVDLPFLESFALVAPNVTLDEVKKRVNRFLRGAPCLRSFQLFNQSAEMSSVKTTIPWNLLYNLKLGYDMSLTECVLILSECTVLRKAEFARVGRMPFEHFIKSPRRLTHLQHLKIESIDGLSPLFANFELPSLEDADFTLAMDDNDDREVDIADEWDEEHALEFLRHTCVKNLTIDAPISEAHLIDCFKNTRPTLRTLRVTSKAVHAPYVSCYLRINLSGNFIECVSSTITRL